MDDGFLEKHPLVKKAFAEQADVYRQRGAEAPAPLIQLQLRGVELIEQNVAGEGAEKEALMAGVVLGTAPPQLFSAPARFAGQYAPEVQKIVDSLIQTPPGTLLPAALARITLALHTAMMEDALNHIKAGKLTPDPTETAARKRMSDAQEPLLIQAQCPALREAYDAAKHALYATLGLPAQHSFKIMHPVAWPPKPN